MGEEHKKMELADGGFTEHEHPKGRTPWDTLSARVISMVSRKGGVGKTTSAVNLGAAFALSGHSVLIVGLDPQCGVSRTLGYGQGDIDGGLGDIFTSGRSMHHLAHSTPLSNLFFVSPNIWSLEEEEALEHQLDEHVDVFLQEIDRARNMYDTILIDCPPSFGSITRAALLASDSYLVPVQAEELCRDSLGRLLDFIGVFTDQAYATSNLPSTLPSPLKREGLFLTMVNQRTRMSRHVMEKVNEDYTADIFETVVPRTTRLTEMALKGKPAVIYDRRSPGSRAYFNLADEVLMRYLTSPAAADRCIQDTASPAVEKPAVSAMEVRHIPESKPVSAGRPGNGDASGSDAGDGISEGSGIDRLLQALHKSVGEPADRTNSSLVGREQSGAPEMVSLDEVLAEEERLAGDGNDWEDNPWGLDGESRDRLN